MTNNWRSWAPLAVLVLVVLLVLMSVLWVLPIWFTSDSFDVSRIEAMNEVRTTLVQVLGGSILVGGLYFTAQSLRLSRQGQMTEHFGRAVEQLGHREVDVRIGGIYALERLLRESQDDHQPITEILSAFIRLHAARDKDHIVDPAWRRGTTPEGLSSLRADVQAALTVLGRRPNRLETQQLNLRGSDLRLAFLHGARLQNVNLNDCWLDYADLGEIDLRKAHLRNMSFAHAWMRAARLDEAHFADTSFRYAILQNAVLSDTRWWRADWVRTDLSGAVRSSLQRPE